LEKKKITNIVADLMTISAETSPKSSDNFLEITSLDLSEREMLAEELYQLSDEFKDESYSKEGDLVNSADELMLIGLKDHKSLGIDCRACGYEDCEDFDEAPQMEKIFEGPSCAFKMIDLGMSIGRALNTAENHNVDCRPSIRAGLAAKNLGLTDSMICYALLIKVVSDMTYYQE